MGEWKEYPLGEICSLITDGKHGNCKNEENSGHFFLSAKDVFDGKLHYENARQITKRDFEETDRRTNLQAGDLLITNSGTIGRIALALNIPETRRTTFQKSVAVLKPINDYLQNRFFYYAILGNYAGLIELAEGTTQQNLLLGELRKFSIKIPPLPEQKAIASVLSSLDDKIDLLHRQNKSLEAIAETLFRQWFVATRAGEPHAGGEEAQEDWEEKPLSFFGEIICGKTPSKKIHSYFNGKIPFIKIPDMHGNIFLFETADSLTEEGKQSQANKTLPPKSICVSCIATVGLVSINAKESQTNQQINSIIPQKDYYRYFLYLTMKSYKDLLHSMASGGTATLNLNTGNFSKIPILYPGDNFLLAFQREVEPYFDKIFINQTQIQTLEKLRDTLLPKLMSGVVRMEF